MMNRSQGSIPEVTHFSSHKIQSFEAVIEHLLVIYFQPVIHNFGNKNIYEKECSQGFIMACELFINFSAEMNKNKFMDGIRTNDIRLPKEIFVQFYEYFDKCKCTAEQK